MRSPEQTVIGLRSLAELDRTIDMCTNYRPTSLERARQFLGIDPPPFAFRDEVYPGHAAPILRLGEGGIEWRSALFGMIPPWSKTGKDFRHCYNARTETVASKPSFRHAWRKRQFCVVPMDAFYEPNYETGKAVRWRIQRPDGDPLFVAGLWEVWKDPVRDWTPSFTMLTINATGHAVMQRFHAPEDEKRMLVMLEPAQIEAWLRADEEHAPAFFERFPAEYLTAFAESRPTIRKA